MYFRAERKTPGFFLFMAKDCFYKSDIAETIIRLMQPGLFLELWQWMRVNKHDIIGTLRYWQRFKGDFRYS